MTVVARLVYRHEGEGGGESGKSSGRARRRESKKTGGLDGEGEASGRRPSGGRNKTSSRGVVREGTVGQTIGEVPTRQPFLTMLMLINISRGFEFPVLVTPENRRSLGEVQVILDEYTNIALVGQVSAGKTSFINSYRGLYPRFSLEYRFTDLEFGLRPIGNREVTQEIQKYRSTGTPNTL